MIKKWLSPFKKNNEQVERELFEQYYERVYFSAYFIIKDRELAQDIVQETFIKAFKHLHTIVDEEKLGAWLSTIATRTAIDYVRKEKKWNEIVTDDVYINDKAVFQENATTGIEELIIEKQQNELMIELIDCLKLEYKQVIILRYLHELSYEEISKQLNIKVNTVKSRTHRAKKQLKEVFEQRLGEEVYYEERTRY